MSIWSGGFTGRSAAWPAARIAAIEMGVDLVTVDQVKRCRDELVTVPNKEKFQPFAKFATQIVEVGVREVIGIAGS